MSSQVPAKCTVGRSRGGLGWLYSPALGEYPYRCTEGRFLFTVSHAGMCCEWPGFPASDHTTRYGRPSSLPPLESRTAGAPNEELPWGLASSGER
jgi:hypothetical protein